MAAFLRPPAACGFGALGLRGPGPTLAARRAVPHIHRKPPSGMSTVTTANRFLALRGLLAAVFVLLALLIMSPALLARASLGDYSRSPQFADGRFHNGTVKPPEVAEPGPKVFWDFLFNKPSGTEPPAPVPVRALTRAALEAAPDRSLWRLGHSTILMKLRGGFWLADPVFSERASPVQWAGPKRFHAPPLSIGELPPIRGVLLSHDHYDHLDEAAIRALAPKVQVFLAPLGVGDRLVGWGVPAAKVRQFDWWQGAEIDGLRLTATPAQHFSGRGIGDRDRTLWASWVIEDGGLRVFFSGDTGYFDGFAEIGRRFGPFALTLMETGAYNPASWPWVHMQPAETVRAHRDLRTQAIAPRTGRDDDDAR